MIVIYDKIRRVVELNTWIRLSCIIICPLLFSIAIYNSIGFDGYSMLPVVFLSCVSYVFVCLVLIAILEINNDYNSCPLAYNPFKLKKIKYEGTYLYKCKKTSTLRTFSKYEYTTIYNNSDNIKGYTYKTHIDMMIRNSVNNYKNRFSYEDEINDISFR